MQYFKARLSLALVFGLLSPLFHVPVFGTAFGKSNQSDTQKTIESDDLPGKVASIMIRRRLERIVSDISNQKSDVLPHELKDFRKDIGNLKIITDIFIFSFPKTDNKDPLLKFRKDLDEGYLVAGEFKDLFDKQGITLAVKNPETGEWSEGTRPKDIEYPKDALKEKRKVYQEWAKKFQEKDKQKDLVEYFSKPILEGLEMRKQKDISRMYWGGLPKLPSSESNLAQYLSLLIGQLVDVLSDDYTEVIAIDDILHDEIAFHDVRKRMRSLVKIHGFFKEQIDPNSDLSVQIKTFESIASNFGAIHDKMIGLENSSEKEKQKRAEEIKTLWDKERNRLKELDILRLLDEMKIFVSK